MSQNLWSVGAWWGIDERRGITTSTWDGLSTSSSFDILGWVSLCMIAVCGDVELVVEDEEISCAPVPINKLDAKYGGEFSINSIVTARTVMASSESTIVHVY
jgi:hypothetical protein